MAFRPGDVFLPRQLQTPQRLMQQKSLETAASAFLAPSVISRGWCGSASISLVGGGTSMTSRLPGGVSYLIGLPLRRRGLSGRNW
jgi:hypothetical protein